MAKKSRPRTSGTTDESPLEQAERLIRGAAARRAKKLWLNELGLITLPETLGNLKKLQLLDISNNQLTALPESLGQLKQLQSLDISNNQLSTLPESLGQLKKLRSLNISKNRLTKLPESLGQLAQLIGLKTVGNRLAELPESLRLLTQLQGLYLAGNRQIRLPQWLGELEKLLDLNIANMELTALPEWLGQLRQLQGLTLANNRLTVLPESLGDLTRLKSLDVENNRLTGLPQSLRRLTSLRELYLQENKRLKIPREILGPTWPEVLGQGKEPASPRAILDYYFSTRGTQGRALRELKLIVVGRGGAGKTSIIRRLNGQPLDAHEYETHGIVISPLAFRCGDGPVTAHVWDFGGQHVLHAMHEFFLTARSLYLLVLGERDDMAERDVSYWLQLIRSYAGPATVVVALNKCQGRPREIDRATFETYFGPIAAWVPTECDDKLPGSAQTIENLRAALTRSIEKMPEVRAVFPSKWWDIKQWLEEMKEPYLDYAAYQQRCIDLGETNSKNQEKLSAWMHDLGLALNYARDPRLHDTTVLRPDWLANGIYAILRANDPRHPTPLAPNAALKAQSLGPIYASAEKLGMLQASDYPRKMWPFLLRLMSLFQLAFPMDEKARQLLVPTLLPVEPPPGAEEPAGEESTRLRYEFPVVPAPLLPRFLVRTFCLIEDQRHWRRGAILRYGDARARVWATQDERWVRVTATGAPHDRDELLTMIRRALSELFIEYKDLHPVEQWEHEGNWVPRRTLHKMGVLPEDEGEEVKP
jgi:internalin A